MFRLPTLHTLSNKVYVRWTQCFGHPIHRVKGPIDGGIQKGGSGTSFRENEGYWETGDPDDLYPLTAHTLVEGDRPELHEQWAMWQKFLKHPDGKTATRERAYEILKRDFPDIE